MYGSLIVALSQNERPQTHEPKRIQKLRTACNVVAHIETECLHDYANCALFSKLAIKTQLVVHHQLGFTRQKLIIGRRKMGNEIAGYSVES